MTTPSPKPVAASGEGNLSSRPVFRDGQPVECREAVARRDALIEQLAGLPAVPGALDQIIQHFGTDQVAEVTGRSRRIVRKGEGREARLAVENRAASANLAETSAFMDDRKRILVFSDAGGTGRSYHADLGARNQRLRVHYLLEPGWKADAAIQGLGRTNRTNQAQPPLFRPIATDVKAEKRFLSTIARRLDTLGAITRGQRQTGGQGLFRPEDNLESAYARDALRQLYQLIAKGKVEGCSLDPFEAATGLKLMDATGLKDDLPPITTFLNRLLALPIALQGILFAAFEQLLEARIAGAMASGSYDMGLETLRAESFRVIDRQLIHTHPGTGAETRLLTIAERRRNQPVTREAALAELSDPRARLLINERSGRAAVQIPTTSIMLDDGEIERRVRLIRPMEAQAVPLRLMAETHWVESDVARFSSAWDAECAGVPEFTESTLHMVTGLLLPIWKRLPPDSTRVYRLQADDGERIIGRRVSPAWAATASVTGTVARLTPEAAHAALMEGRTILDLAEGLQLRRARVMGVQRIELIGFTDLVDGPSPTSLYLVVPPSDINRTKPLIRLILNQIGRRLTEELKTSGKRHRLLLMLDEFPALGRLDFFESALAFMAGYGLKSFLIAQSLNQIERAYGPNNAILDNCHVRVAFATNDERTAKRISDALGTATEMRDSTNYAGHRLAPWLGHLMVSRQETARPLLTPGEVMQLPPTDEIVMVAGVPPIRATKARYFEDPRFRERVLPPPDLRNRSVAVGGLRPSDDWSDLTPAATSVPSDASDNHAGDPANAGIRREPELPEQEEIVPPPPVPVQEFDLLDDEPNVDAAQARAIRHRMRMVARQVAMNPDDGIEL